MEEKFKFSINVRPRYGDEFGATGVVYDLTYVTWAREAQAAYVRHLGLGVDPANNSWAVTVKMEAVFSTPLLMTEEAKVYIHTTRMGRSSITREVQINEAASGRPVATITSVRVTIDAQTGRSIPTPDETKQKIVNFEGKENVEVAER